MKRSYFVLNEEKKKETRKKLDGENSKKVELQHWSQKTLRKQNHQPPKPQSGSKEKTYWLSAMILHSSCLDNQPIKITTQFSGSEWRHWMAFKFWNFVNFFSHFLISLKFYIVVRWRSNSIPWCTSIHVILSQRTWHIIISNLQHAWSEHRSQCSMWMVSKHVSVQQLLLLRLSSWLIFIVL